MRSRIFAVIGCLSLLFGLTSFIPSSYAGLNAQDQETKVYSMGEVDLMPTWSDCAEDRNNDMRVQCLYSGMSKFLIENLKYPQEALDAELEAKVMMALVVLENGSVDKVRVVQEIGMDAASKAIEKEATRVILALPLIMPGVKDGLKVRTEIRVPVQFALH